MWGNSCICIGMYMCLWRQKAASSIPFIYIQLRVFSHFLFSHSLYCKIILWVRKKEEYIYTHTHTKTCTSYSMRLSFYPCWILSAGSRISPIQFILSFTLTESFTPTLISVSFNSPPYLHLSNLHLSPFSHDTTLELKTTLLTTPKNQPKTQWRQCGL